MIHLDLTQALDAQELNRYQERVSYFHQAMKDKTEKGHDFLGWTTLPFDYDRQEFEKVKNLAKVIREKADTLIVCGIGGLIFRLTSCH